MPFVKSESFVQRFQVLKLLLLQTLLLCLVFGALNLMRGSHSTAIALLLLAVFSAALLWHIGNSRYPQRWSLCFLTLFFITVMIGITNPAVSDKAFIWLMMIPTIAHFIHGRRLGLILSLGFLSVAWTVYYYSRGISDSSDSLLGFFHIVSFSLALTLMIYLFEYTRENAEKQLHKLASTDPLTGLSNRYQLKQSLEQTWEQARRFNRHFSVMTLDLDWFKSINDRYGHDAGDRVLLQVADLLRERLRASDNPSRWGGEEFLVLLPETDRQGAGIIAETFRATLASTPLRLNGDLITVTASIGIAEYPGDTDTIEELLILADRRLYHAKEQGRNRVVSNDDIPVPESPANPAPEPDMVDDL